MPLPQLMRAQLHQCPQSPTAPSHVLATASQVVAPARWNATRGTRHLQPLSHALWAISQQLHAVVSFWGVPRCTDTDLHYLIGHVAFCKPRNSSTRALTRAVTRYQSPGGVRPLVQDGSATCIGAYEAFQACICLTYHSPQARKSDLVHEPCSVARWSCNSLP